MVINEAGMKPQNMRKKMTGEKKRQTIFLFCMLILPVANWLVFWLYVNLSSIALAFQDARTGAFTWNNFIWFWESLTSPHGDIGIAVENTFKYFGTSLFIIMPLALLISYFLYKQIVGYKMFRVIFYLPAIVSGVAMVAVYVNFINPNGPLNEFLNLFGKEIPPEGYLARPDTATNAIIIYTIWTGFCTNILLFCGAMVRVPIEVLESAALEGCGPFRELIQIILPMIWPTVSTQIIFLFTGIFSASGPILLFGTQGEYETTTIAFWIFIEVYSGKESAYNLVSASGLVFTVVGVPIILFIRWLMEKIPSVEY